MSGTQGIAILGAGIFAKEAHLPALATLGGTSPRLKAVYSRSEKSAHELAEAAVETLKLSKPPSIYYDGNESTSLDVLLAQPDITAVIIVLPITLQPAIILKALAAGKHVLSEKPVAPDVKAGLDLINTYNQLYKQKGLIWRVAENFEAEPGFRAAGETIRSGKIGNVLFFKATAVNYIDKESRWYKTPWRTVPDYQGGFLLDGGVHTLAALRVVLPSPLTQLSAFASLNKDYLKPHDTIHAIAKAEDGSHGIAELTWAFPTQAKPPAEGIVITGSAGWLSATLVYQPGKAPAFVRIVTTSITKKDGEPETETQETVEVSSKGSVSVEISSFLDAISGKDDGLGLGDPIGALADVAFIQAALNSNGEAVDLAKLLREG